MSDRITFDPTVTGGRACVRGMRIAVVVVVNLVATGKSIEIRAQALNVVNSANFLIGAAANEVNSGSVGATFGQTRNAYRDITVSGSNDPGGRIIEFLVRFKF